MTENDDVNESFNKTLHVAFKEIQGSSAWSLDRNRPYDGQPHTDDGIRGKTKVEGLTMRDISDCIVKGFLTCGHIERENPVHDDIYKVDLNNIDPGAVIQNALCEIEKMMGIFPNVPPLKFLDEKDGKYKTWDELYGKDNQKEGGKG